MKPFYVLAIQSETGLFVIDSVDIGRDNRFETRQAAAHARLKMHLRENTEGIVIAKVQIVKEGK